MQIREHTATAILCHVWWADGQAATYNPPPGHFKVEPYKAVQARLAPSKITNSTWLAILKNSPHAMACGITCIVCRDLHRRPLPPLTCAHTSNAERCQNNALHMARCVKMGLQP